jgi:hypothetical protein
MLLGYYMEDTEVKKRVMVEPSTWWLRTKSSEKDENAILSTNFAKASNVRLRITLLHKVSKPDNYHARAKNPYDQTKMPCRNRAIST